MAWSKYNPHDEEADPLAAANPEAARRAKLLQWGTWISFAMMMLGYGLMIYWLFFDN